AMQEGGGELEIAAPEPTPALCPCAPEQLVKLKAEYQDALREVTKAGNSVQAYPAERNISSNLAYVRLHRARHSLRERLVAVCGSCAGSVASSAPAELSVWHRLDCKVRQLRASAPVKASRWPNWRSQCQLTQPSPF